MCITDVHTVDVEEREKRKSAIALTVNSLIPRKNPLVDRGRLQQIGDHVAMRQHHALRQTRRARRIHQKRHVGVRSRNRRLVRSISDAAFRHIARQLVENQNAIGRKTGLFRSLDSHRVLCALRHQSLGLCIFQRVQQLLGAVTGVHRADDTADSQCTPDQRREVDGVRGEGGKDIAILPVPFATQRVAESQGLLANLAIVQRAAALDVSEER